MSGRKRDFPSEWIGGYPDVDPTNAPKRKLTRLTSRWTILINTNTSYTQHQVHLQRRLIDVLARATIDLGSQNELERAHILEAYHFHPPNADGSYSKETPTELMVPQPIELYSGGKTRFVFETAPKKRFLHEHIDLSCHHAWGEGAFALKINRENFYEYIRRRIIEGTGWDPGRGLFIRIRRIRANMARSYLEKAITMTADEERMYNNRQLLEADVPQPVVNKLDDQP